MLTKHFRSELFDDSENDNHFIQAIMKKYMYGLKSAEV